MKTLKERKAWKILIGIIAVIAVLAVGAFAIISAVNEKRLNDNTSDMEQAKAAGYDTEFSICSRVGDIRLDGKDYIRYSRHWDSFVDGQYKEDIFILKDAKYIDDSNGETKNLVIYGRVSGYYEEPLDGEKYTLVEPYRFRLYREHMDMWAVGAGFALALLVEGMLVFALIIYFIVYLVMKHRPKKNPPVILEPLELEDDFVIPDGDIISENEEKD